MLAYCFDAWATIEVDIKTSKHICFDVMRTTLTLDDDVATQLERLRRGRDVSLKELVNDVLRRGLRELNVKPKRREPFRTRVYDLGAPLIGIDNVAEAIAFSEGEAFK
jgi:hypothetical protein